MIRRLLLASTLVLLSSFALGAHASPVVTTAGPRFGISIDPDQFVGGGQLSLREFAPDWSFDPNLELGFGSDLTTIAFNLDAYYHLRLSGSDWRPYVGGGLGVDFASWDAPFGVRDHSDTNVGVNAVAGFTIPAGSSHHWFTELRFGLGDLPTLKIMGGMNFGK
jgi:opacity protein-like surface antigen